MTDSFAPKGHRLAAYIVDITLLYGVQFVGSYVGAFMGAFILSLRGAPGEAIEKAAASGMSLGWLFWGVAFWLVNHGILQGTGGATLGKRVLGLEVVNADGSSLGIGKSVLRNATYILSALPLYLGFALIFWTEKRQCLHDLLWKTVVLRRDRATARIVPIPLPAPGVDTREVDSDRRVA